MFYPMYDTGTDNRPSVSSSSNFYVTPSSTILGYISGLFSFYQVTFKA